MDYKTGTHLQGTSMEYFPWNVMGSLWKISHFSQWYFMGCKTGTVIPQDRQKFYHPLSHMDEKELSVNY